MIMLSIIAQIQERGNSEFFGRSSDGVSCVGQVNIILLFTQDLAFTAKSVRKRSSSK